MDQKAQDLTKSYSGGRPAFGYKFEDGNILTVPKELKLVKKAYKLYSETNYGINKICEILFGPRKNKNARNHKMYGSVRYWFTNIFYVGYHQWTNNFKLLDFEYAISIDMWNIIQIKRCKVNGRSRKFKPFILDERVPFFHLTDEELIKFGLQKHRKKHKI